MTDPTPNPSSPDAIAARIRGLIAGQDAGVIEATARRLGVSELALRMSIDKEAPVPALEVVVAIVREYGVDPTWLATGDYDVNTHRLALEDERLRHASALRALIAARLTPPSGLATQSGDLRLEA